MEKPNVKKFTYFYPTKTFYSDGKMVVEDGYYFDFEVDIRDLEKKALILISDDYFNGRLNKEQMDCFLRDFGLLDNVINLYEKELKIEFEDIAIMYERRCLRDDG
jgi:hypothetical protein